MYMDHGDHDQHTPLTGTIVIEIELGSTLGE